MQDEATIQLQEAVRVRNVGKQGGTLNDTLVKDSCRISIDL